MSIKKDIKELLDKGVITEEVAHRLNAYYQQEEGGQGSKTMMIFTSIGGLLIGLGAILLIAHNWDELSRGTKTFLALVPVLLGQLSSMYAYLKKPSWTEASTIFLGLSIGACITLIAQIYHITGDDNPFFFTWAILTLPMMLFPRTLTVSILSLVLVTAFGLSDDRGPGAFPLFSYWLLYGYILYRFWFKMKFSTSSFFKRSFSWLLALSPLLVMQNFSERNEELLFINYFLLFNVYFTISQHSLFDNQMTGVNAWKYVGLIGMNATILLLGWYRIWEHMGDEDITFGPEICVMLALLAITFIHYYRNHPSQSPVLPLYIFTKIPFVLIFLSGYLSDLGFYLMNVFSFLLSIYTIREGIRKQLLSITNIGLLSLSTLVCIRFFDSEFSFIVRGFIFILLGIGFLVTNYWLLKKPQSYEA